MEFEFIDWEPAEKVNPYIEIVKALAEFTDENKGYSVIVHKSEAIKTRTDFAKAANAIGKTARVRVNGALIEGTENVRFVFTLTKKHKARKGAARNVESPVETPVETPVESPVESPVDSAAEETVSAPKPRRPRKA